MTPFPHHYSAHLTGGPAGYGDASSGGVPDLRVAAPADFDGPGDAWSPEQMLLAAVEACFLLTFRAVARLSKVEWSALAVDVEGTVDRQEGVTRFTEIVVRPTVTVPPGSDHARVLRIMERAEQACLITASLATPVRLEAQVAEGTG